MVSIAFFQQGNDTHTVLHIIELKLEFATKKNNNKKKKSQIKSQAQYLPKKINKSQLYIFPKSHSPSWLYVTSLFHYIILHNLCNSRLMHAVT